MSVVQNFTSTTTLEATRPFLPKGKEYNEKGLPQYTPLPYTIKEIRGAIPTKFFVRNTARGLQYLARDIAMVTLCWYSASFIDRIFLDPGFIDIFAHIFGGSRHWQGRN
ncbi:hypothetical protein FRB94_002701 [Tulasnella sp. JGI-2019a]|nr:hypothetical protein FRB93_008905 [Tulasnella sp. JGI-2019a]KAG9004052.1 hypothetical protein FRB94_002701 [Tulasnella sp. JGI-2019a]